MHLILSSSWLTWHLHNVGTHTLLCPAFKYHFRPVIQEVDLVSAITSMFQTEGFPGSSVGKEPICNAGDPGSIPGSGRSPGDGTGYPLQYSWASLVAQLVKDPPAMQETWFNPWVGKIPWRRERLPTAVLWPEEFHGLYSPWDRKKLGTTERLSLHLRQRMQRRKVKRRFKTQNWTPYYCQ